MNIHSSHGDDLPSLLRRSFIGGEGNFENRNSEDVHRSALAAAHAEHKRIRENALRAYELNELRIATRRLREQAKQDEERLKIDHARALEEIRIREIENAAKRIPVPPPRLSTPPPPPSPPKLVKEPEPSKPELPVAPTQQQSPPVVAQEQRPQAQQVQQQFEQNPSLQQAHSTSQPLAQNHINQQQATVVQQVQQTQPVCQTLPNAALMDAAQSHILPGVERFLEIHKNLKQLRSVVKQAGLRDKQFKKKTGEMRRAITMSVGQLTGVAGGNRQPMARIIGLLEESLRPELPSPPYDPRLVVVSPPDATAQGTSGDHLPALFIFLLNMFAKSVVSQFIQEAGVSPKTADPVGVVAVSVFARAEFCWRGKSLIDILMCKFRVVCPTLFGFRGNEKTEEGRARLGWRKENGQWVDEQVHHTRMTGLGAGYAALSLRDFSKSKNKNPWPSTHYWQTIASITSTPGDQVAPTQYMVLKSLIENSEKRFLTFYGSAGRAALRVALVDFPAKATQPHVAISSLAVLADKLEKDMGLRLR